MYLADNNDLIAELNSEIENLVEAARDEVKSFDPANLASANYHGVMARYVGHHDNIQQLLDLTLKRLNNEEAS